MGLPFKDCLYTRELTPSLEVPDEFWAVLEPIIGDLTGEHSSAPYPWFQRLGTEDQQGLLRYCVEMDRLHEDFELVSWELGLVEGHLEDLYRDDPKKGLYFCGRTIVYHRDNADVRVHAYREKVYKLLDHFMGGVVRNEVATGNRNRDFNKRVRDALSRQGLGRVVTLLNELESDKKISAALRRRNKLVHECAQWENWPMLQPNEWINEQMGSTVSRLAEKWMNFPSLLKETREEIAEISERLVKFRFDLVGEMKATLT